MHKSIFSFLLLPYSFTQANYHQLISIVKNSLKQRFAGSIFGLWWIVLSQLLFVTLYTITYALFLKISPKDMSQSQYILNIMVGLIPFMAFSESLGLGTMSIEANKSLFKNTVFPIELVPVREATQSLPAILFGMGLVFISAMFFDKANLQWIFIPGIILSQYLFVIGLVLLLSLVQVVVKDLKNIISFVTTILMLSNPISYTVEMVPSHLRFIIWMNPLTYFTLCYQNALNGTLNLVTLAILLVSSWIFFALSISIFKVLKKEITNFI